MKRNSAKHQQHAAKPQQHTAKSQSAPQAQHAAQTPLSAQAQLSATGQMRALRIEAEDIVRKVRTAARASAFSEIELQKLLHDIQVQQVELELQNDELRQAQHALEVSRARYFDLYDLAPVGYFMLDENGLIVEANLTGANLLGVPRAVLLKQPLSRFIVGEDADSYYMHRKLLLQTGEAQGFELRLTNGPNASFPAWIETTLTRPGQDAPVCRVVVSDITQLKAVQEQLQHSQRLQDGAGGRLVAQIARQRDNVVE
jgi:PAS domain S-box-containing protein